MNKVFALIDCNSFFASCERIFNPSLEGRPVIVLSNNDGCVIARTKEAKALGIKMAQPFFEIKAFVKYHNVFVASTNFTLYGDISNRVMATIRYFLDEVEVYSIDEAFVELTKMRKSDLSAFAREIKDTIMQWTGVPVSIGIATTKTLAKAANELAKQHDEFDGVLNLYTNKKSDDVLRQLDVVDIWGVGRQSAKYFYAHSIRNALQLKQINKNLFSTLGVNLQRTVLELRGISCDPLEKTPADHQTILCSRTFKSPILNFNYLASLVTSYVARATEKLREQKQEAHAITIFIQTSRFNKERYYGNSIHLPLPSPTASTLELIKHAHTGLEKIYRDGFAYKRAGVILSELHTTEKKQLDIFSLDKVKAKKDALMQSLDEINNRWGYNTIKSAAEIFDGITFMRQQHISPKYTSQWDDLPIVKA